MSCSGNVGLSSKRLHYGGTVDRQTRRFRIYMVTKFEFTFAPIILYFHTFWCRGYGLHYSMTLACPPLLKSRCFHLKIGLQIQDIRYRMISQCVRAFLQCPHNQTYILDPFGLPTYPGTIKGPWNSNSSSWVNVTSKSHNFLRFLFNLLVRSHTYHIHHQLYMDTTTRFIPAHISTKSHSISTTHNHPSLTQIQTPPNYTLWMIQSIHLTHTKYLLNETSHPLNETQHTHLNETPKHYTQ